MARYATYDISTHDPLFVDSLAEDMVGAFGCYDWQSTFTFLLSRKGHMSTIAGVAR